MQGKVTSFIIRRLACALVWLLPLICLGIRPAAGQATASLDGFVSDVATGETLLFAAVLVDGTQQGTATNNAGYYTVAGLAPGTYAFVFSYVGYQPQRHVVTLTPGDRQRLDVALTPDPLAIEELVVTADRSPAEELYRLGLAGFDTDLIKRLPAVLEPDVFRALQLLPGVHAASDFSTGLYIRGGTPGQTLTLLDGNTIYHPGHVFGFFSLFNPDAIKDVKLYKGGYPATYGGRLGSVVDIYNKDGNRNEQQRSVSIGLLAARAQVEGPHPRGSWMVSARRSTMEPLLAALNAQDVDGVPTRFYFYDVNAKVGFDVSKDDRVSLSVYQGFDSFAIEVQDDATLDVHYGNQSFNAGWTHIFNGRLFSSHALTASRYESRPTASVSGTSLNRTNGIRDVSLSGAYEWVPGARHGVQFGYRGGLFSLHFRDAFGFVEGLGRRVDAAYGVAYLQETYRPTPSLSLQAGLRAQYFDRGGYLRLDPRAVVEYQPIEAVRLQAGYGRYHQFLSLLTTEFLTGFDLWLPADRGIPPSHGDQYVAGLKLRPSTGLGIQVEGYYRTMKGLFELDPLIVDAAGVSYADRFRIGDGYAYGAELAIEKPQGRVNGFLNYTYSQTRRRFPNVNRGDFYAPRFDRAHDAALVVNVELGARWELTSVLRYASGQAFTQPIGRYVLNNDPFEGGRLALVTEFNNSRLPAYHRMDLGVARSGWLRRGLAYELQLQVLNVYSRRNVWFYTFDLSSSKPLKRREEPQLPVPIPNLSLTLKF